MKHLLWALVLLVLSSPSFAQHRDATATAATVVPKPGYLYYLYITGITEKQQVEYAEEKIAGMQGVQLFQSREFPPVYFRLKTDRPVTQDEVASWVRSTGLNLTEMEATTPENEDKLTLFLRRHKHIRKGPFKYNN